MEKFPNLIILQLEATLAPANKHAHTNGSKLQNSGSTGHEQSRLVKTANEGGYIGCWPGQL